MISNQIYPVYSRNSNNSQTVSPNHAVEPASLEEIQRGSYTSVDSVNEMNDLASTARRAGVSSDSDEIENSAPHMRLGLIILELPRVTEVIRTPYILLACNQTKFKGERERERERRIGNSADSNDENRFLLASQTNKK